LGVLLVKQKIYLTAFFITFLIWRWDAGIYAQKIEVLGVQQSEIQYRLAQDIEVAAGTGELIVSFVVPVNFRSLTCQQQVSDLNFEFRPLPGRQETKNDTRGNQIRTFFWQKPAGVVNTALSFRADNRVNLEVIRDDRSPFPMRNLPREATIYLQPTAQVQADDPAIQAKAQELTASAATATQASRNILFWVVEHMQYILMPEQYDALYAFRTGKGNCQNYSHLAAALMRAVGIPVRIVNGITLDRPYSLKTENSEYQFEMAQGRHSWIEVFFPQIGWVPFDPQRTEFFVSNRYVRIEVGIDNDESINDGLVRWRQSSGTKPQPPRLEEVIETTFIRDDTRLSGKLLPERLRKIVLGPPVESVALPPLAEIEEEKEIEETPDEETSPEEIDYSKLQYTKPFVYGNLDFPEGVNFAFPRQVSGAQDQSSFQLQRSFLVETAEYVTAKTRFAQMFILKEPIRLEKIALALHKFGGSGTLWLELSEDENGKPGQTAVRSKPVRLEFMQTRQGYHWIDFDFSAEGIVLSPGRYWFFLNYNGGAIVNWFYSYGKPVGPSDGTRSRAIGQTGWPTILSFEFNYRVTGKAANTR
jgi:hypothetical protein